MVFRFARPDTVAEAIDLLGDGARVLSGGTDLIVGLRKGKLQADLVIDLKRIPDLAPSIEEGEGSFVVSANTVMTDLIDHPGVRRAFPALVEAAAEVGSIQIRNRATLVGNICNASPAADTVPPLLVYGASVEIWGRGQPRRMPVAEFIQGPGKVALAPHEIVARVILPTPDRLAASAFARLTRRRGVDLATVSVCCGVATDGTARFALGAAGPRPFLVTDPSGALADPNTPEVARAAILERLMGQATPISDVRASEDYRRAMLLVLGRRTLARALERRNR